MSRFKEKFERQSYVVLQHLHLYRKKLWFYPFLFVLGAILLFVVTSTLDQRFTWITHLSDPITAVLLFGGDSTSARSLLTTIGGAWTTMMGVVFSITMVVLQLAGNKFLAQLIPRFEQDRITQVTLGSYAGIVTYSLLLLKTVRVATSQEQPFIPYIGINVAVVWAVLCLLLTIWFIAHLSSRMQPVPLVRGIAEDGIAALEKLTASTQTASAHPVEAQERPKVEGSSIPVYAQQRGYVQAVSWVRLFDAVCTALRAMPPDARIHIKLEKLTDVHLRRGDRLAQVVLSHGEQAVGEELAAWLQVLHRIDEERSVEDDPSYAVDQLVNLGIKTTVSGDVSITDECIRALIRFFFAATDQRTPESFVASPPNAGQAFITLRYPPIREQVLDGLERVYTQLLQKRFTSSMAIFFRETGLLMDQLVQAHQEAKAPDETSQRETDTLGDAGVPPARYAESLDMLLSRLEKLYQQTVKQIEDSDALARLTQQWLDGIEKSVETDDPLVERILNFLAALYESLLRQDKPQVGEVIVRGIHQLKAKACERENDELYAKLSSCYTHLRTMAPVAGTGAGA